MITWVAGKVEREGDAVTIPVKHLSEYVQNLPSEHVRLVAARGALTITCAGSRASFQGESAENFPLIPTVEGGIHFSLPARPWAVALDETLYAASADDTRPELSGVLLTGSGTTFVLAATDSYRLGESRMSTPHPLPEVFRAILPLRAAHELRRVLDGEASATVTITPGQLLVETGVTHLVSRLIDGTYPEYTQIIPERSTVTVGLLRSDLLRAIRGAGVFTTTETKNITIEAARGVLRVRATAQELGDTATDVAADVEGGETSLHFNHRYLQDALQSLPGERVRLGLSSSSLPAVFRPEGSDHETLALVMPIKT